MASSKSSQPGAGGSFPVVLTPEIMGDDFVSIYVGKKRKRFTVHKKLLCTRSDYFAKAFGGGFKEGQEAKMYLSEDDPDSFAIFVGYLYRGSLAKFVGEREEALDAYYEKSVSVYLLAEKLCLNDLMNVVMDILTQPEQKLTRTSIALVRHIYENTHEHSKLRKLCAYDVAWISIVNKKSSTLAALEIFLAEASNMPDFAGDIFSAQVGHTERINDMRGPNQYNPFHSVKASCEFHVHEPGQTCSKS